MKKKKRYEIPYSKKLKKLSIALLLCVIILCMSFILNIVFYSYSFMRMPIIITIFITLIVGFVLYYFYDKELKIVTDMSIIYYKQQISTVYMELLVFMGCFVFAFISNFVNKDNYITIDLLTTINISIFSLIFVLYLFILPTYNKILTSNIKKLQKLKKSNSNQIVSLHGKIYYNSKIFNSLTITMIISVVLFCISLFVMFMFNIIYLSYLIMFFSIFYYIYFITRLIEVIWKIYQKNINDIENLLDENTNV